MSDNAPETRKVCDICSHLFHNCICIHSHSDFTEYIRKDVVMKKFSVEDNALLAAEISRQRIEFREILQPITDVKEAAYDNQPRGIAECLMILDRLKKAIRETLRSADDAT